jgi:hypothetical protein
MIRTPPGATLRAVVDPRVRVQLRSFLRRRSLSRYLDARAAMMESREFDPRSTVLPDVLQLLGRGRHDEVVAVTRAAMGNWILNAGIHVTMSRALAALGDSLGAKRELEIGGALLGGLLQTGDGSVERPYLVLRTADQYDVLARCGLRGLAHQVACREGRAYDAVACGGGRDVWFDVTDAALPRSPR